MKLSRIYILAILLFSQFSVFGEGKVEFRNATPRETVVSHFEFLEGGNYNPEIAAYTLGETKFSARKNKKLVIRLKEILLKYKINFDDISDRKKSFFGDDTYILSDDVPIIYLERIDKKWVYSKETVNAIDSIYNTFVLSAKRQIKEVESKKEIRQLLEVLDTDTTDFGFSLSSPYNTIVSHLVFLSDSLFDPLMASKTINISNSDMEKAGEMAIKLNQIFLGASKQLITLSSVSKDSDFLDSVSRKHIYYPNPDIKELYLEKIGDEWLYSRATSKLINSVHRDMYNEDAEEIFKYSDKFKKWAGHSYKRKILTLQLWQWLMFGYFLSIFIFIWAFNFFIVKRVLKRIESTTRYHKGIYKLVRNGSIFIYLKISEVYIPSVELGVENSYFLYDFIGVLVIVTATAMLLTSVNLFKLFLTRKSNIDSMHGIVIFSALIIKSIILVTSLLFIISELEFNLVNVLAGLSIGGFALALGAQDTIKNFFGSLMIFADHPFAVGDFITDGDFIGTVEEVGLRTTRIRTTHNSILSIPNSNLSDNNIDNLGKRQFRRFRSTIVLKYHTPEEKIQEFIDRIKQEIENHPNTRKYEYIVSLNDFVLYGVEIFINVFFQVSSWEEDMDARHVLMLKIIKAARELDIEFAIPPK